MSTDVLRGGHVRFNVKGCQSKLHIHSIGHSTPTQSAFHTCERGRGGLKETTFTIFTKQIELG